MKLISNRDIFNK